MENGSIFEVKDMKTIERLVAGWDETFIWSCLQGIMGKAYTNDLLKPKSVQIIVGDFCLFAGAANENLVRHKPADYRKDFVIMAPQTGAWEREIEAVYGRRAAKRMRYATKKEDRFDRKRLKEMADSLPEYYELKRIDEELHLQIMQSEWAMDLCYQFERYEEYERRGLGMAVVKDGKIVSGASSYIVFEGGIEIEIDTKPDERRKGFAAACGAALILECLDRGLYPSWDAHSKESLNLAQKLGYQLEKEYPAYEVTGY